MRSNAIENYANEYKGKRQTSYPSWQQQMDMQYWDAVNGTTTWKDAIAKIKSDNPKPRAPPSDLCNKIKIIKITAKITLVIISAVSI